MLEHISTYFLPITFNTTYQKIVKQSNAGTMYENVQFEYLVETYINNENTDSFKNWYYTYGYNMSYDNNSDIFFTNNENNGYIFNNKNTAIKVNPKDNDSSWKLLDNKNILNKLYLPTYGEVMQVRLYIPKINIAAWGENEEYIINTYLSINGKKIYLSSGISNYLSLNANDYKVVNNQVYTQYYEFNIPSPYSICEDDVWSEFRSNVLGINSIINAQHVNFEIIPYSNIDNNTNLIYINYAFNQSNYTWLNSNNPWYLTLSNYLNKNILNIKILFPETYLNLKEYLNNFKYYSYDNESSNVSFEISLGIYDLEGNIYWGLIDSDDDSITEAEKNKYILYKWSEDSGKEPDDDINFDIKNLPIDIFNSWKNFKDNLVLRTFLTIKSDLRFSNTNKIYLKYPDIQLLSNRIPINKEIFKYLINGFEYNNNIKINFDNLNEMQTINLKVVNENKKEEIVLNNPTIAQIIKPVFFRVEVLPTIKINKIKENISLNLIDYINKVTYFSISINGNIIKESGRAGSQVVFNIPGEKIWSQLNLNGDINSFNDVNNIYLLNQDGDIITSGKYVFR